MDSSLNTTCNTTNSLNCLLMAHLRSWREQICPDIIVLLRDLDKYEQIDQQTLRELYQEILMDLANFTKSIHDQIQKIPKNYSIFRNIEIKQAPKNKKSLNRKKIKTENILDKKHNNQNISKQKIQRRSDQKSKRSLQSSIYNSRRSLFSALMSKFQRPTSNHSSIQKQKQKKSQYSKAFTKKIQISNMGGQIFYNNWIASKHKQFQNKNQKHETEEEQQQNNIPIRSKNN